MTFDLLDWIPVQTINPNDVGLPTVIADGKHPAATTEQTGKTH